MDPHEPVDVSHDHVGAPVPVEERGTAPDARLESGREASQGLRVVRLGKVVETAERVRSGVLQGFRHAGKLARAADASKR